MKKVFVMLALAFAAVNVNAQTTKGRVYIGSDILNVDFSTPLVFKLSTTSPIGGSYMPLLGFGSNTDSSAGKPIMSWGLNINGGYFIADNWAIGAELMFGGSTTAVSKASSGTETLDKTSMFGIAPYVRYAKNVSGKLSLFADGGIRFMSSTTSETSTPAPATAVADAKMSNFGVFIAPGVMWSLNDNWVIQGRLSSQFLGFSSTTNDNGTIKKTSTTMGLNLNPLEGLTTTLGLYYYFGK